MEYSDENLVGLEPYSYLDQDPQIDSDEMELAPLDGVYAPRKYDVEVVLTLAFKTDKNGVHRGSFNATPFQLPHRIKPLLMSVMDGEEINDDIFHIEVKF